MAHFEQISTAIYVKPALLGLAIGDALGVPVEFTSRQHLAEHPVTGMQKYGTHNQKAGTWSDDSSLTFCLAEGLILGFNLNIIANNFVRWVNSNYWTPRGLVFDIGIATQMSISRLAAGIQPEMAGGNEEFDNGNGSLMRILPLAFYIIHKPIEERYKLTKAISALTHRHIRSVIACFYYLEFAIQIMKGINKLDAYQNLQIEIPTFLMEQNINISEITLFDRLLKFNIFELNITDIKSSGYVIDTLEASIWSILTTNSYQEAVLKAVNLGEDTDTIGAITGGIAGMIYGEAQIPDIWKNQLARINDILELCNRIEINLNNQFYEKNN